MPDYDPKNIPILDDIIEDDGDEKAAAHDKIIVTDEMHADDDMLNLFNETTADIETDSAEPRIGTIDKFINADKEINIEAIETPDNETSVDEVQAGNSDVFESALIDYPHEIENDSTQDEINAGNSLTSDEQNDRPPDSSGAAVIAEPAIDLDEIIDDVVTQLLPELEQQLRSRLKQALQEQLPQELIEPTAPE